MKVQLLVSESCPPCDQAESVWRVVASEHNLEFSVLNLAEPEGQQLANRLHLKTIPALVVNDVLVAIGVQSPEEAHALVMRDPLRKRP